MSTYVAIYTKQLATTAGRCVDEEHSYSKVSYLDSYRQ